jgi:thiol-disulfide isomerase/thioredoxin
VVNVSSQVRRTWAQIRGFRLLATCLLGVSFALAEHWETGLKSIPLNQSASIALPVNAAIYSRPALLQFWASWCQSCGALMFDLEKLQLQHPAVRYVAISVDTDIKQAKQAEVSMAARNFRAPHFFDLDKTWAQTFSVVSVPTLILLDASGAVRFRLEGHLDAAAAMRLQLALVTLESRDKRHGRNESTNARGHDAVE